MCACTCTKLDPTTNSPGVNIYVAKRNQEREGKSREGQGMEGKSREGKGREEQGSYLQPSPTSVHTLPIPIWTPPCPGVDPSPRHTPPSQIIGPPTEVNVNETTSLGTWWSSTSVLKKKTLDGIRHRLLRYFCHFHRLLSEFCERKMCGFWMPHNTGLFE